MKERKGKGGRKNKSERKERKKERKEKKILARFLLLVLCISLLGVCVYVCVCVRARGGRCGCVTAAGSARGAGTRVWLERTKGLWGGRELGGEGAGASRPPVVRLDPAARGRAEDAGRAQASRPAAPASHTLSSPQAMIETIA